MAGQDIELSESGSDLAHLMVVSATFKFAPYGSLSQVVVPVLSTL